MTLLPARDEPSPAAPEELVLGPRSSRQLPRWLPVVAVVVAVLVAAGATAWHFWPRPVEPLSLADLQNTYAGMVRADGTNEASVMNRQTMEEAPLTFTPAACGPLLELVVANRPPAGSIDGVGTFWLLTPGSSVSLLTWRFPDAARAATEARRIEAALDQCANRAMYAQSTTESGTRSWQSTVERVATAPDLDQTGYLLRGDDNIFSVRVMLYLNTVTWQYRLQNGSVDDTEAAADQLMSSFHLQLDTVVADRPG